MWLLSELSCISEAKRVYFQQIKQRRQNPNFDISKSNEYNDDPDSNRYSDDLTFDSGIAGSYREHVENMEETDEVIVKATDGSKQNLTSFFPSMSYIEVSNPNTNQTNDEEKYKDQVSSAIESIKVQAETHVHFICRKNQE